MGLIPTVEFNSLSDRVLQWIEDEPSPGRAFRRITVMWMPYEVVLFVADGMPEPTNPKLWVEVLPRIGEQQRYFYKLDGSDTAMIAQGTVRQIIHPASRHVPIELWLNYHG